MTTPKRPARKTVPQRPRGTQVPPAGAGAAPAANEPPADSGQMITDARAMRALAHPLRVALLELMQRDGEITATRAAELLDENPGNMSWHLQTLAKYGFVEETGEGRGRSRPWRIASTTRSFETGLADPEVDAAGEALVQTFAQRAHDQLRQWWSRRLTYPAKWQRAAFISNTVLYLTPSELTAIMDETNTIYARYRDRKKRPADALPVHLYAHGHPLPPTPSGN